MISDTRIDHENGLDQPPPTGGVKAGSGEISSSRLLLCGGVSGMMCWTFSYPQDVIKSRIQIQSDLPHLRQYRSFLGDGVFYDCFKQTVHSEGWLGLWKGFGPCAVRAFIANAAGFTTYEAVLKHIRGHVDKRGTTKATS